MSNPLDENVVSLAKLKDRSVYKQDAYTRMLKCLDNLRKELTNPFLDEKSVAKINFRLSQLENEILHP